MPFDPQRAIDLCRYAWDAYYAYWTDAQLAVGYKNLDGSWQQAATQKEWLQRNGYQLIVNPNGTSRDGMYFGVVATAADSVIVALRGTDTWNDFAIDVIGGGVSLDGKISFPFAAWTAGQSTVWAHKNFLATYLGLQTSVRQIVKKLFDENASLTKLYVTGHSLGGALATLAAVDLATALAGDPRVARPRLWTYASPFVGDQQLATLENALTVESYRINQPHDWVPGVPSRGWTPAWMNWYDHGKVGPEPTPKFAPYVHVGDSVVTSTNVSFPSCHYLTDYYNGCYQLLGAVGNPVLRPHDLITSLVVRIKTRDELGAGTDNDVFIGMLRVSWGPLDKPGNDFEPGSIGTYDLFAMFPSKVPPNPRVSDLDAYTLELGDGVFYFSVWTMAWSPEWVEITVNGIVYTKSVIPYGYLTWSTSRYYTVPISVPS